MHFIALFFLCISILIMKSNIWLKTESNNNYFYNRKNKKFYLSHPVFSYIGQLIDKNDDVETWFKNIHEKIYIKNFGHFSKSEIEYYLKKYYFFESVGIFARSNFAKEITLKLSEEEVESSLANCDDVAFELTQQCNLNYKYCTYNDNFDWFEERRLKKLEFINAKKIIDYILNLSESNLNQSFKKEIHFSFYGGEPLLEFTLIEKIVNYIKIKKLKRTKTAFTMTTNGTLLSKHINFFVENNFNLLISIDGNEIHSTYRVYSNGKPSYSSVMKNILYLRGQYPKYFETNVDFNSVLTNRSNSHEIRQFFKNTFNKSSNIFSNRRDKRRKGKRIY